MGIVDRFIKKITNKNTGESPTPAENSGVDEGMTVDRAVSQPIGREQVAQALVVMNKYKEAKAKTDQRIKENEEWYKLRHWEYMRKSGQSDVEPVTAWLFNCIASKHADAMDNFPQPNILPRQEDDKQQAKMLSDIVPVIMDQCGYEQVYNDVSYQKLKSGLGCTGVFWNSNKLNGLGDIDIKKISILSLFWEPGITDIQSSRNVFHVELMDNDLLFEQYPQLKEKMSGNTYGMANGEYLFDSGIDTSEKTAVIDWYYKKKVGAKTVLHYCKFVGEEVLFATENEEEYRDRGFYDHGLYPFVIDVLFGFEDTIDGFGYIDVGKDSQEYIDRLNQAILENALANARPRYFFSQTGSVNEKEFSDLSKTFVHVDGQLGEDSVMPIKTPTLPAIYVTVLNNKIEELKETTGNRDVSNGGTSHGVTAASAVAALQESAGKLSRDSNKSAYRSQAKVVNLIIELIRQYYDAPRCFRITGDNGDEQFVSFDNRGIQPQVQINPFVQQDENYRLPVFDIKIVPQKASPYTKMSQNELAIQMLQLGVFNPQLTDQAALMLDMMDFDGKDELLNKVTQNGTLYQAFLNLQQQAIMLAQMVDQEKGTNTAGALAQQFGMQQQPFINAPVKGGMPIEQESGVTRNARQRTAETTQPR